MFVSAHGLMCLLFVFIALSDLQHDSYFMSHLAQLREGRAGWQSRLVCGGEDRGWRAGGVIQQNNKQDMHVKLYYDWNVEEDWGSEIEPMEIRLSEVEQTPSWRLENWGSTLSCSCSAIKYNLFAQWAERKCSFIKVSKWKQPSNDKHIHHSNIQHEEQTETFFDWRGR